MDPISIIFGISALVASASQRTEAARVSIMGDRAEELGYARPPGLTPAWRKREATTGAFVEWIPVEDFDTSSVPRQFPWLKQHEWKQIIEDVFVDQLPKLRRMYWETIERFPMRVPPFRIEEALYTYRQWVEGEATDLDKGNAYRRLSFFSGQNIPGSVRSTIYPLILAMEPNRDAGGLAMALSRLGDELAMHKAYRMNTGTAAEGHPVYDETQRNYRREVVRDLARRIDGIAPWRLS